MPEESPFNPLDKRNLGVSVADALLAREPIRLGDIKAFKGAGIYALYYTGKFLPYASLVDRNRQHVRHPIYVGKAVPAGARKGGFGLGVDPGQVLYGRLREHAETLRQVQKFSEKKHQRESLRLEDFYCRYLVVDDIWIPLGEAMLIDQSHPIWNMQVDGFGNHDPGKGRYLQQRSAWDTLHPGRSWAIKCQPYMRTTQQIIDDLKRHLAEQKS